MARDEDPRWQRSLFVVASRTAGRARNRLTKTIFRLEYVYVEEARAAIWAMSGGSLDLKVEALDAAVTNGARYIGGGMATWVGWYW
ncbi:hypothetical protein BM221_006240 [Beauveria bassiana]|uniref:Uncharacterized protein n=1 Tax=Beauveria bassiana TaxID=176275 RepID=A0A2N6NLD4_BEABA|nr:hypothetical protein BM221_006240 [Beauveria bassiana]